MDAEPDETITTSSEVEDRHNQDSPMQQSPDQSDYNENYRSPESVNSVPLDEDIDEIIKDVEIDEGDIEQSEGQDEGGEGQDEEQTEVKMDITTSDKSDNEASISGIDEAEAKNDVCEEDEVSHSDDCENKHKMEESIDVGDEDINNMEENSDANVESMNKMEEISSHENVDKMEEVSSEDLENLNNMEEVSGVADTSSALIAESSVATEEDLHVSQSNLSTNEVSSTSKGENFEAPDDLAGNADSLDDVSEADSNDFKPNNTLDDVSDENSDDFNDESNVNQSDLCTSSHDDSKFNEESVTNTTEASNSEVNVQKSDSVTNTVSSDSRTTHIESSDNCAAGQCLKDDANVDRDSNMTVSESVQQTEDHSEESSAILKHSENNKVEDRENTVEVGS